MRLDKITNFAEVLEYQSQLRAITKDVHFLMSLFVSYPFRIIESCPDSGSVRLTFTQLHTSVTPEVIAEAAAAGITGVKMYPQGKSLSTLVGQSRV